MWTTNLYVANNSEHNAQHCTQTLPRMNGVSLSHVYRINTTYFSDKATISRIKYNENPIYGELNNAWVMAAKNGNDLCRCVTFTLYVCMHSIDSSGLPLKEICTRFYSSLQSFHTFAQNKWCRVPCARRSLCSKIALHSNRFRKGKTSTSVAAHQYPERCLLHIVSLTCLSLCWSFMFSKKFVFHSIQSLM